MPKNARICSNHFISGVFWKRLTCNNNNFSMKYIINMICPKLVINSLQYNYFV
nr:unnamed protein product [Callosobruchus chinensis]